MKHRIKNAIQNKADVNTSNLLRDRYNRQISTHCILLKMTVTGGVQISKARSHGPLTHPLQVSWLHYVTVA